MEPGGISGTLKRWRAVRGLSQRALAGKSAVGFVTIARLETGGLDPRLSTLARLAAALGIRVADLVADVDRPAKARQPGQKRAGHAKRGRPA